MKLRFSKQRNRALTLVEVLVVIVVLAFLAVVFFPWPEPAAKRKNAQIECVNNLKQVGIAFRVWSGDCSDNLPMQTSTDRGGAKEPAELGIVYPVFQVMSNELSTPEILICPADTSRLAATDFATGLDNSHVSYFVGVDAAEAYPQRIISGDGNFAVAGVPVKSGMLLLSTNDPVTWTPARHVNKGNLALADGSVSQADDKQLVKKFIETEVATNRLAIP